MTPIQAIIQKEAEKRFQKLESEESCLAEQRFSAGAEWMAEHMGKFAEWASERYTWVEGEIWDGDDDETYRTQELIDIYFESINKEKP